MDTKLYPDKFKYYAYNKKLYRINVFNEADKAYIVENLLILSPKEYKRLEEKNAFFKFHDLQRIYYGANKTT